MQDLTVAWEHARAQFPEFEVSEAELRAFLGRHSTADETDHAPGGGGGNPLTVLADMYLACACARGDTRAIAVFQRRYTDLVEGVRLRFRSRAPSRDELWSELSHRLFVRTPEKGPKIEEYAGRSELGAWVRVVVSRLVLNRLQAEKPEDALEERMLDGLVVTDASPELALGRAEHKALLRKAFAEAARELPPRERRILRLAFGEGFTIDDIGGVYNVHRSTAARWIKEAVATLGARVSKIVRAELRLTSAQYESWARALGSSMDVSVARYLDASSAAGTDEPR
jgi:RNA polymerase sigma-70 factor, ECF subfamily